MLLPEAETHAARRAVLRTQTPAEPGISCAYISRSSESVNSQCCGASFTQTISWLVPLLSHSVQQQNEQKESCSAELRQEEQRRAEPACEEAAFKQLGKDEGKQCNGKRRVKHI